MAGSLKVLIADDHPLMLQGIRRSLENSEGIDVVGQARSGDELMALVARRKPDLVLLDLRMPGLGGVECVTQIKQLWPEIKTVILSASDDRPSIDAALRAGASAFVVKSVDPVDIPAVLRQAAGGAVYHAAPTPSGSSGHGEEAEDEVALTPRERTILAAVANGRTTKAISQELWLSEHTVKFHLTNIYRKLGVPNRSAAVRYALEHGLTSDS